MLIPMILLNGQQMELEHSIMLILSILFIFQAQLDILSGTVKLTLDATQVECVDATDFMILTIVKEPTVDAGPDTVTICQDGTATLSATATDFDEVQWTKTGGSGTL